MTVPPRTEAAWRPDVLGAPFEALDLPLGEDREGPYGATLVRRRPEPFAELRERWRRAPLRGIDVLYIHGWTDYFFQRHLAETWASLGARFYAVDLRKYGRSLRPGQTPGLIADLADYDAEIAAARHIIDPDGTRRFVLMGHSTGGLTASLWAERHPGALAGLVLNSPWLEFQAGGFGREAVAPFVQLGSRWAPLDPLPGVDFGFYARAVSRAHGGEWDLVPEWRPENGFAVRPAWLAAIFAGHQRVARGLSIDAPVLTLLSARSTIRASWSEQMRSSDSVLVVDDIAQRALGLGPVSTIVRFDAALHDVFLSRAPIRERAAAELKRWARGYLRD